jgi:hypothetical protein
LCPVYKKPETLTNLGGTRWRCLYNDIFWIVPLLFAYHKKSIAKYQGIKNLSLVLVMQHMPQNAAIRNEVKKIRYSLRMQIDVAG